MTASGHYCACGGIPVSSYKLQQYIGEAAKSAEHQPSTFTNKPALAVERSLETGR